MTQKELVWSVIKTAMASVSDLCIVQMQDYLTLGEESRMNFPGTMTTNNWTWRAWNGFASEELAERIAALTERYGRAGSHRVTNRIPAIQFKEYTNELQLRKHPELDRIPAQVQV